MMPRIAREFKRCTKGYPMSSVRRGKRQSIVVWRDSVAAGDDFDAPHEIKLYLEECASVAHVVAELTSIGYLPSISGGRATWIVEAGSQPIAVLAQQWSEPRYLVPAAQPMTPLIGNPVRCHIRLKYCRQTDPDSVLECLKNGSPLPNSNA